MNAIIKNTVITIIGTLYLCHLVIHLFFPVVDSEINNFLFLNDSLLVSIIIFIVFCGLSYLSFKEILFPDGCQYKHRVYRGIRGVIMLFGVLLTGFNVYLNI